LNRKERDMKKSKLSLFGIALIAILSSCTSNEAPVSEEVASSEQNIQQEPVRECFVDIDPSPSCYVCFYTADPWDDDEPSRLMVFDTSGRSPREMTCVNSAQFSWINEVEWKPDATEIAVLAGRGGSTNIFTINVASDNYNRLTQDDYGKDDLAWSPNGQYLAYTQIDSPDLFTMNYEIVVMDVLSEDVLLITETGGHASEPVWTSDSQTILYSGRGYQIFSVDIDGSSSPYSDSQAEVLYRSRENRYPNFDYNALADYWESLVEIEIDTPHWAHGSTFLTFRPYFFGPAVYLPDSSGVILKTEVRGAEYYGLVDPETFSCTILEPESDGYPYQSPTEKIYWLSNDEFLFFGNRNGPEGFATLDISTGQYRWLVSNENAEYDFKCWDGVSLLDSREEMISIDEICENGLILQPGSDEPEVLGILGEPVHREAISVEPPYLQSPEYLDSLITLSYDDITVMLWKHCNSSPVTTEMFSIEVTSDEHTVEYGVKMGFSMNQVHEVFGVEHRALQYQIEDLVFREYSYSRNESGNPLVRFRFENGALAGMSWVSEFI
jgi:hypothetical protein